MVATAHSIAFAPPALVSSRIAGISCRTSRGASISSPLRNASSCASAPQHVRLLHMGPPFPARRVRGPQQLAEDAQEAFKTKPAWCQPSTILLTGSVACAGSLAVFRGPFLPLALLVNGAVFLWWWTFLVLFPAAVLESRSNGPE